MSELMINLSNPPTSICKWRPSPDQVVFLSTGILFLLSLLWI